MTGAALGFMVTTWSLIFIAIAVTMRPLLKGDK
ncbi:hypothetical protein HNQ80_000073 [Anaerosolibacter carboniphilus]|uniref:Uncharacterized protein n=1 Tax=Anaerosolibacter carboniphilus TaxID=1417629 RepID=A0A841KJF7_9FIRM|nr:hypothetical protein [Anaerosolibacter carboniphilus]